LEAYRAQMAALISHQDADGSWHQVVDVPSSYRELTVTAMAITAMARGIRLGWLDRVTYLPVIERGWNAVAARVAPDGSVRDACASTAAGTTLVYYLERPVVNGVDDRAGGLVLLAAVEVAALLPSR
ncbi:MAG TPA: glycoside hydrolase family 88 protein, partial [Longimicrobiaceae bacterium]|nr:glycoside hydrolase family 88 protein [Longimicrobiaceae bacterium]